MKKSSKSTVRAEGVTTYGVSGHETLKQLFLYVGCRTGSNRSKWLHSVAMQAVKSMMALPEYAKDLEGVSFYFDEKSGDYAAVLPEHISNFQSPKKRLGKKG